MAQVYRYLAFDLMTNVAKGDVPLNNVSYDWTLNSVGSLTADVAFNAATAADVTAMTEPERTLLIVERYGVFMWGGVVWTRNRSNSADGPKMTISAAELGSLLHRNRNVVDLTYTATDQLAIAQDLVTKLQAQAGAAFGISVGSQTSGVPQSRTYNAYERGNFGDLLDALSAAQNGFDWAIEIGGDPGTPTKTLNLGYPRRGRVAGSTGVVFAAGKNLMSYTINEDGTTSARAVDELGDGDGSDMLISTAAATPLLDAGFPLTAETLSARGSGITDFATLDGKALSELNARANTPTFISLVVDPDDVDGGLGHWIVGDDALIDITDDMFPRNSDGSSGLYEYRRIISASVSVPDSGKETVTVTTGDLAA